MLVFDLIMGGANNKRMKIIICDVGNAACAFVTSSRGHTMMIDCGSSTEKENPVDVFRRSRDWLGAKDYCTKRGSVYPITLLHITHPDDDHVRNALRVIREIPPYLVHKDKYEAYPDGGDINREYVEMIDIPYRGSDTERIDWGFECNNVCQIPVDVCIKNDVLSSKVRNNSSIIRYVKEDGVGILFCGDLEKPGWDYLVTHNYPFFELIKDEGVSILVAPHHGHKSGFPKALFDVIGDVDIVIHSKDTEAGKDGTDVSSQYTNHAKGRMYNVLSDGKPTYFGRVLTTRSNGNIYIDTQNGPQSYFIWADKASPNHTIISK